LDEIALLYHIAAVWTIG